MYFIAQVSLIPLYTCLSFLDIVMMANPSLTPNFLEKHHSLCSSVGPGSELGSSRSLCVPSLVVPGPQPRFQVRWGVHVYPVYGFFHALGSSRFSEVPNLERVHVYLGPGKSRPLGRSRLSEVSTFQTVFVLCIQIHVFPVTGVPRPLMALGLRCSSS